MREVVEQTLSYWRREPCARGRREWSWPGEAYWVEEDIWDAIHDPMEEEFSDFVARAKAYAHRKRAGLAAQGLELKYMKEETAHLE